MAKSYEYLLNAYNKKHSKEYQNTMNSYSRYINDYSSYMPSPYKNNNYSFNPNSEMTQAFYDGMYNTYYPLEQIPIDKNRGFVNRAFDVLNVGNYMSAGFARGFVDENITPFEGMIQGLRASNPLGDGHEEWEYDYSGVLEQAGWKPETFGGKALRFGVGLVGDIFLDPMTYVSGGVSALLKGTGKHSVKALSKADDGVKILNLIDEFADGSKYMDDILDLSKGLGMNLDTAKEIIKDSKVFKSGKYKLNLEEEANKFLQQYNKLIGVTGDVADRTLSLANAPFGNKLFGKYADKSITLVSGETLQKIGDATLSPAYAKLRSSIIGGKIGEMFSETNHYLYKLSKSNPDEVYNFFKKQQTDVGLTASKLSKMDKISLNAELMKKLTPAEVKEVMDVMENPSKWNKIDKMIRFVNTDEVEKIQKKISINKMEIEKNLVKASRNKSYNKRRVEKLFTEIADQEEALELLQKQRLQAINAIDVDKLNDIDKLDDFIVNTIDANQEIVSELELNNLVDINDSILKYRNSLQLNKQAEIDYEASNSLIEAFRVPTVDVKGNIGEGLVKGNGYIDGSIRNTLEDFIKKESPFSNVNRTTANRYKKQLNNNGYIKFAKGRKSDADNLINKLNTKELVESNTKTISDLSHNIDELRKQFAIIKGDKGYLGDKTLRREEMIKLKDEATELHLKMNALKKETDGLPKVDWQVITDADGSIKLFPPKEYSEFDFTNYDSSIFNKLDKDVSGKYEFIDDLSTYVFGKKGMLSYSTSESNLNSVVNMIEEGRSIHAIADEIFNNRKLYNGASSEMWTFIAKRIGYDKWEDFYTKPMEDLALKEINGKLSSQDKILKAKLLKAEINRNELRKLFKDATTLKEHKDVIEAIKNPEFTNTIEEVTNKLYNDGLKGIPLEDLRRNKFSIDDYLSDLKDGDVRKQYHKAKSKAEIFELGSHHRNTVTEYLADRYGVFDDFKNVNKYKNSSVYKNIEELKKLNANKKALEETLHIEDNINIKKNIKKQIFDIDNNIKKTKKLFNDSKIHVTNTDGSKSIRFRMDNKADNKGFVRMSNEISNEIEKLLQYGGANLDEISKLSEAERFEAIKNIRNNAKNFGQLTELERKDIIEKAIKNYNIKSRIKSTNSAQKGADNYLKLKQAIEEVTSKNNKQGIKIRDYTQEFDDVIEDVVKNINSLDDISDTNALYDDFVIKQTDLYENIIKADIPQNFSKLELKPIDNAGKITEITNKAEILKQETIKLYDEEMSKIQSTIDTLNNKKEINVTKLHEYIGAEEDYIKKIDDMNNALNNLDALETFAELNYGVDKDIFHQRLDKLILDPNVDISPNAKNVAQTLRDEFLRMGKEEIGIGKMKQEQFEAMAEEYLPHILTDEGKVYLDSLKEGNEVKKYIEGFGDSFGYGREFDPFAKTRTIKDIYIDGKLVKNPTIQQINKHFKEEMLGNNLFSENIADIYLNRAIKNVDLMYDNAYMENMLEIFGDDYTGELREGFNTVINYGKLKQFSSNVVRKHNSLDISDNISSYIENNKIMDKAKLEAELKFKNIFMPKKELAYQKKKFISEFMQKEIDKYFSEELTDAVISQMYVGNLENFFKSTDTFGMLDDVSMPLGLLDDVKIQGLNDFSVNLKDRYFDHIQSKFFSFYGIKANDKNMIVKYNDLDEMISILKNTYEKADDIDMERIDRIFKRYDEMKEVTSPQIKQVNNAIIQKANQSRKLQIYKDNNKLLDMYDKFTHLIKLNQTTVLPSFHLRNIYSNKFNSSLAIGQDAINPKFQSITKKVMNGSNLDELLEITNADGTISKIKWSDVLRKAEEYGVLEDTMFANELGALSGSKGLLGGKIKPKYDPTNTKDFFMYKKGMEIGSKIEGHDRFIHFASQVKNGMSFEDASKSVDEFLFDYSDLSFFEANVMKRIFPYYTWLRKNSALQLTQMLEQPNKYRYVSKVINGVEGMSNEDDRIMKSELSDFAQDWIQLPFSVTNDKGNVEPILLNPNLPYLDLNRIPDITDIGGSIRDLFSQTNPIIKTPIELMMNKNTYFDSEIRKEGDNKFLKNVEHVGNQLGLVPQIAGFAKKDGVDLALHTLKNVTGVTTTAYDVKSQKQMAIKKRYDDYYKKENTKKKIIKGFNDAVSYASYGIEKAGDVVGDMINQNRPTRPDEYVGALRPISEATYNKLPDVEKANYTPPTNSEVMYYNNRAIELEQQALQESGVVKKFIWSLVDVAGLGTRNKPYQLGNVTNVKDGDTFDVDIGGKKETVRLLLVDSPEVSHSVNETSMPIGDEAKDYTEKALIDKDVKIYFDGNERDKYGRLLAYIEVDGRDFNRELLEEGMGKYSYEIDPPYKRSSSYKVGQDVGGKSGNGIWGIDGYSVPSSNIPYSTEFSLPGYNEFKKKKISELVNKKSNISTNPSPFNNIMQRLK